jgi:hypothetical protein
MASELDASTFQRKLETLAEVLAQKLRREAPKLLGATPSYVSVDLHVMLRQMIYSYNLFFYLNADERVEGDPHYRKQYSIVMLPLIRNMIDCFYNITSILQNPALKGFEFRSSGYKAKLEAFNDDAAKYGGQPEWDEWIARGRAFLRQDMLNNGFKESEVLHASQWPTLGRYVKSPQTGGAFSPHQQALKLLNYGPWREYSALAHTTFDGLLETAASYIVDMLPHEDRPKLDEIHPIRLSTHIAQAAGILICVVTELQAYFHFDDAGACINERIHEVWNALIPTFTVKELYTKRYAQLMQDKGINP